MKVKLNNLLFLLLIPAFIEAIGSSIFIINIPGFPLSLGRLGFVLSGITLLIKHGFKTFNSKILLGLFLIYIGATIGSILAGQSAFLVKALGSLLLFIAACGNVHNWNKKVFRKLVDGFFITLYIYWIVVSFIPLYFSGFLSYAEIYKDGDVINHHVPGLLISVSSAYIAVRFFYINNKLKLFGYVIFFISIALCVLIESRSNFLFSLLTMLFLVIRGKKNIFKLAIGLIPLVIILFYFANTIIKRNEILEKRFTLNDMDYQERTTGMRFEFIQVGLIKFIEKPLGSGASDIKIKYKGNNFLVHNQYLTFLISGGILAFVGLSLFFLGITKMFLNISKINKQGDQSSKKYLIAFIISNSIFFITLFTIEIGGIMFFIITSFAIYITREIQLLNYNSDYIKKTIALS